LNFAEIFGIRKRVPGLSCGVVCVILHLAVPVEHRLVTDGQTDRHTTTANPALASVAPVKIRLFHKSFCRNTIGASVLPSQTRTRTGPSVLIGFDFKKLFLLFYSDVRPCGSLGWL